MDSEEAFGPDMRLERAGRVAYLINGFNLQNLTDGENEELSDWICASLDNQRLFEELSDPDNLQKWIEWRDSLDPERALQKIKSRIGLEEKEQITAFRKMLPWLVAAAAMFVVLVLGEFYVSQRANQIPNLANAVRDLAPGGNHATLTLANGKTILLDTGKTDDLNDGGDIQIMRDSSMVEYAAGRPGKVDSRPNILTTPAGGTFQVVLSDGTRIWLNASSSLKYPELFSDSVRAVELTGEGYFEVAKDAKHPFIVQSGGNSVRVLGTHFDVNNYSDNKEMVIALAEGTVKLNGSVILKPGQEGNIKKTGNINVLPADIEMLTAWKNGSFIFRQTPLEQVMNQVAHWYDAKIIYQVNITDHFNAEIRRNVPVSKLLHLLEKTGRVHFKIENRTITVMN
jgi:transmembrane sensor